MDLDLLISNFLNPPILFFFLGLLAVFVKSDLEIPAPIRKILSLYLLFAIGFKGGVGLAAGVAQFATALVCLVFIAFCVKSFVDARRNQTA